MKTARFWVYWNAPVKISLKPGQTLAYSTGRRATDEGWDFYAERWTHEGDRVRRESISDGVDCDGRLSGYCESESLIEADLQAGYETDGVVYPRWREIDRYQRDYQAEAAGY